MENIKDWEREFDEEFSAMFFADLPDKANPEVKKGIKQMKSLKFFISQLLSQQKQEIIEKIKLTQFDVDGIMRDWTDDDWVDAGNDNREIANYINAKIETKSNNL